MQVFQYIQENQSLQTRPILAEFKGGYTYLVKLGFMLLLHQEIHPNASSVPEKKKKNVEKVKGDLG